MNKYVDERSARQALAEAAREIYGRRLSGASDGNLSVRIGADRIATTPSGGHKGRLRAEDIVITDLTGRVIGGGRSTGRRKQARPSSEIGLHLIAYARRPDVSAVVHAHPPMAIAYQLAGGLLSEVLVSEVVFACGQVATAPYTTPTTLQVPEVLGDYLACYDVVLMARHGSVTVGADLDTALARLDALEHTAHIYTMVKMMGGAAHRRAGSRCPAPEPAGAGGAADDSALVHAVLQALTRGER